jgi:hypothetical protein
MSKSSTKEYHAWEGMKARCYYEKDKNYKYYGGRGIIVCERWVNSFDNFVSDMGEAPTKKHSIDRIDVDGNYEPTNCRWATMTVQIRNRRNSFKVSHNGETLTLKEWGERLGLKYKTINHRVNGLGWDILEAITTPKQSCR